jgi:hypothetical protein
MPFSQFERRRFYRFQVQRPLQCRHPLVPEAFELRDISLGGFAIDTPVFFRPGEEQPFEFRLPDGRVVTVRATTAHCLRVTRPNEPDRYVAGFAFVVTQADEPVIEDLVNCILEGSTETPTPAA